MNSYLFVLILFEEFFLDIIIRVLGVNVLCGSNFGMYIFVVILGIK